MHPSHQKSLKRSITHHHPTIPTSYHHPLQSLFFLIYINIIKSVKQQNTQTPPDTCRHAQMCVSCSCDGSRLNRAGPVTVSVLEELFSSGLIMELWATGQRKQMPEQEVVGSPFMSSLIFFSSCHTSWYLASWDYSLFQLRVI